MVFFLRLPCKCEETASPFGYPTQVFTQVHLARTCDKVLAGPFGQGFTSASVLHESIYATRVAWLSARNLKLAWEGSCIKDCELSNRALFRVYIASSKHEEWWNRELTLKCKLKCYVKPMKDPLGVSPSKGNRGTTRGKDKILLTLVEIEPTTSGLDLLLLCWLSYKVGQLPPNYTSLYTWGACHYQMVKTLVHSVPPA